MVQVVYGHQSIYFVFVFVAVLGKICRTGLFSDMTFDVCLHCVVIHFTLITVFTFEARQTATNVKTVTNVKNCC